MKKALLPLFLFFIDTALLAQQKPEANDVLNSLSIKPHSSINRSEFKRQYGANKVLWDKAFEFLRTTDLSSLPVGRQNLAGDSLYVSVTFGPEKVFDSTKWESHKNYIDLQYVIMGKEKMGKADVAKAKVVKPYDDARDVANYEADGQFYMADPSQFFIFFPLDAHRPNIKVEEGDVKKIVIKIRAVK